MRHRILIGVLSVIALLALWVAIELARPSRHSLRDFDPHEVAGLETRMWRSYYDHRSLRLFADLVTVLRKQYHLPFWRASAGAYHAARGAVVFQRGHNRAEHLLALPDVVRYYTLIRKSSAEPFPVQRVSEEEVEWWIVHRQRDRHAPGDLAHALAVEQADLYQRPESDFAAFGQERANAMLLRDRGAEAGGVSDDQWMRIGRLLDDSWTSLHRAVNR